MLDLAKDEENHTVRCFVTKCKMCDNAVLYWESSRGSKVFFNYPIGEKLQRHICKQPVKPALTKSFAEQQYELHHRQKYQCPICGKIFDAESTLNQHIQHSPKDDLDHLEFRAYFLNPTHLGEDAKILDEKTAIKPDFSRSAHFGRITVRKAKKK